MRRQITCSLVVVILILGNDGRALAGSGFQLEVIGGWARMNPADLNLQVDYIRQWVGFYFQQPARFYGWRHWFEEDFRRLTGAPLWGGRLRWDWSDRLGVSLGLEAMTREVTSSYRLDLRPDERSSMSFEVTALTLWVRMWAPSVGLHVRLWEHSAFRLEGYGLVRWLAVTIRDRLEWQQQWTLMDGTSSSPLFHIRHKVQRDGEGKGWGGELGGRLSRAIFRRFGLFVQLGYAFQRVSSLQGGGSDELQVFSALTNRTETKRRVWQGTWHIARWTDTRPWGATDQVYPSNDDRTDRVRAFQLDLSGIRIYAGLYLRF